MACSPVAPQLRLGTQAALAARAGYITPQAQQFSFWRMGVPASAKNCWFSKIEQALLPVFLV